MSETSNEFTTRDLNKLADLVNEILEQSDFEYQDEDYQFYISNLYSKILNQLMEK